ncbi:MAG: methylmalonyl-CoA mutase family protein [Elusimicrobiota bacterium]|nr:methylmalonyl-CoA mutase family protein [Elusimicrobiota bacterium]
MQMKSARKPRTLAAPSTEKVRGKRQPAKTNPGAKLRLRARRWEADTLKRSLARLPERRARFVSDSGLEIKRLYTPLDLGKNDYLRDLGFPGEPPFTRGVQPTMYRSRLWTMRQYAGFGTARETNQRYRYLLKNGQTGLSVAFDLPTQIGYDSDHPLAEGEVGKVGVAVSTLQDAEELFRGIPLDKVSTSMTINSTAAVLLAMYIAVAEKQGVRTESLQGTIQNDILKEYAARGTYIYPPRQSMRVITDIFAFCRKRLPKFNPISISGYHIREAGSSAVQEAAFTIANGIAYVEAALASGMDVDSFASRLSFFFNAHNNFLEEVAKFRAARRLWAGIMRDRFKARDPKSCIMRFHAQTAGSTLTAQQPDNNVVRVAVQAMAAVLGGAQSLHTNSRDEALALPTEDSVHLALRTQQVIALESGIADTIDPLGGSYAVEALTDQIEAGALDYLRKIAALGGSVKAIEAGYMQSEIADSAYRHQREVESGARVVVGVNSFEIPEHPARPVLSVSPGVERLQRRKLAAFRKKRNQRRTMTALENIINTAGGTGNLVPPILEAVKAGATLGEISDALRKVFGEHREI